MAPRVDRDQKVASGGASHIGTGASKKMYWARPVCTQTYDRLEKLAGDVCQAIVHGGWFGNRTSGFGIWLSAFGVQVAEFWCRISCFGCQISPPNFWVSASKFWVSGVFFFFFISLKPKIE